MDFTLTAPAPKQRRLKAQPAAGDLFGYGYLTIGREPLPAGEEKLTPLERAREIEQAERDMEEWDSRQQDMAQALGFDSVEQMDSHATWLKAIAKHEADFKTKWEATK